MQTPLLSRLHISLIPAAVFIGLDLVGFSIALSSLMFSGSLSPWLAMAGSASLICSIVISLALGSLSQLKITVGSVQDMGVAVLASTLATSVSGLSGDAKPATAFAIVAAATLATGLLLSLTGFLKLGRFVRFFPLEVLAGFMAATGFLLLMGGLAMMAHVEPDFHGMAQVVQQGGLFGIVPAVVLAGAISVSMKYLRTPMVLLLLLVGATLVFHLWRHFAGLPLTDAVAAGLLPNLQASTSSALPFPAFFAAIDWPTVLQSSVVVATIATLSLFAALMNVSALEVASGKDMDIDREMLITGVANMVSAGSAGPPGYAQLTSTLLLNKLNITVRGVGVYVAIVELICLFYAGQIVMLVPTFVSAGLILYYGIDLVNDWLIKTARVFRLREWSVVCVIVVISVFYSFLFAIFAGFLIATMLFAYRYAHAPVVRNVTTLARLPSTTERSPDAVDSLRRLAGDVHVFQLQGFLFFGTSNQVLDRIRRTLEEEQAVRSIVIDFSRVTEMDSASANAFKRIEGLGRACGFNSIFCGLNPTLAATLKRAGVAAEPDSQIRFSEDLDRALEAVEDQLLGSGEADRLAEGLAGMFATKGLDAAKLDPLFAMMTRNSYATGQPIITAHDDADTVHFIESGRAVVQRDQADGTAKRLRAMLPGAIIGDIGYSTGGKRTANVIAETQTITLSMSRSMAAELADSRPDLALVFQTLLSHALAEKVITANRMMDHIG